MVAFEALESHKESQINRNSQGTISAGAENIHIESFLAVRSLSLGTMSILLSTTRQPGFDAGAREVRERAEPTTKLQTGRHCAQQCDYSEDPDAV